VKRVAILGSTGSIGLQTLDMVRQHPDRLKVVGLAAGSNAERLEHQAQEFGVKKLALMNEDAAESLGVGAGLEAVVDVATTEEADVVVVAVAGVIGLLPTIAAIRAGKSIALASKEVLVSAGELVMPLVSKHRTTLTPIDSEHSALFQCMQGYRIEQVDSMILTASGGPFRGKKKKDLEKVSVQEALKHPTWNMGGKITVDSATLFNKALEVIEAKWLFGTRIDDVEVVVHPQSIVHSFVKFNDGSVLGQLGWPDMRLPIQYALLYPERKPNEVKPWSPLDTPYLTFEPVDEETFRSLRLARDSVKRGGTMPCVMNAANEEAANAFLREECGFLQIYDVVEQVIVHHAPVEPTLDNLLEADRWAREQAKKLLNVRA
jgi:1-deoxy-D-xylulose-5-phosphate reductoisomerase